MATRVRASAIALFVLCLALFSCEAIGGGHKGRVRRSRRPNVRPNVRPRAPVGGGRRGGGPARPGEKIFNVMQFGARPGGQVRPNIRPRGGGRRRGGPARPGEKIFNVMQFGARPGGQVDCTQAFMQTWLAACGNNGNSKVVVPAGVFKVTELIFSGPCNGPAPIVFEVTGTVKADTDLSNYPNKGWITFGSVDGLTLTGTGTIDAQGQSLWQYNDCKSNPNCARLPASLYINKIKNANIRGINLLNSMGFHMHITNSFNIRIHGITITAPKDSPNTDGIHISKTQTVNIANSKIGTGDDCVSVGQGSNNVTVSRVNCGPGHGISVGSLGKLPNELDVRGVIVKDCTLTGTTNGVRIKTWAPSKPSAASSMVFSNIIMNNVQNPIIIDQTYGGRSKKQSSRVKISDVVYENIGGTTVTPLAVNLMCSKLAPCERVRLSNINLKFTGRPQLGAISSVCSNARAGFSGIQNPRPCML